MLHVIMLNVVMLSATELNLIMRNAAMLSIVRPSKSCSYLVQLPWSLITMSSAPGANVIKLFTAESS